ncbi:arsenate reductase [Marinospirillum celere]|uniref:Arsenate reductase n=1 Tax=Marinospirillum celere TaxID=1122252 RepID=A0A1I1EUN9_9GAMM|nr:arsenate reductase (glutaredoxin) [Marinospirillum celere]SFB88650.1 arsenate reductase [Marinospirillum celere]
MTARLLHNPRCSKSRQALQLLEEKGLSFEVRKYLDEPLDATELKQLLKQLDMSARDLMRKGESVYKELNLADSSLTEEQLLQALVGHPKLIERPILINNGKAVVGRPPEQVLDIIEL